MGEKPITANEMGRRGGTTRAKRYNKAQIRAWGKLGGRPQKLEKAGLSKLRKMLPGGSAQGRDRQETGNFDPDSYQICEKDEAEDG